LSGHWATVDHPLILIAKSVGELDLRSPGPVGVCAVKRYRRSGVLAAAVGVIVLLGLVAGSSPAPAYPTGTWSPTELTIPANGTTSNRFDQLFDVSCVAVGSCIGVGDYQIPGGAEALIEELSDGSWSPVAAPMPADLGLGSVLSSVTCPEAGWCVAVGSADDGNGNDQALIETLSQGIWTATEAPLPAEPVGISSSSFSSLSDVSCPSAGWCVADGSFAAGNAAGGLIETLSQGTWSATAAPSLPHSDDALLGDVSCAVAGSCVTVGSVNGPGNVYEGLIETLSGGTWTPTPAPLPANAAVGSGSALGEVDCPADGSCVALGTTDVNGTESGEEVETLSEGSWSSAEAPLPGDANADPDLSLEGLACAAVGSCVAIGNYLNASGGLEGFMESLTQGSWSATTEPLPAGASPSSGPTTLIELTCPAVGSCVAVGSYTDANGDNLGLIEAQSGDTWTPTLAPLPPNASAPDGFFLTVDCPATDFCVAAGLYQDADNDNPGFIATLSGGPTTPTLPSVVTGSAANPTVSLGQSTVDDVTVTGDATGGSPTGTVTIYQCGPTAAPTPCTSLANPLGPPLDLTAGREDRSTAVSTPFTPTAGGYWCFAAAYSGDANYSIGSDSPTADCFDVPPKITSPSTTTFTEGRFGSFPVSSSGGYAPVAYSADGTLPSGVTLSAAGVLSGTPAWGTNGSFPIAITVTDGSGITDSQNFVLSVNASSALHITTSSTLPSAQTGVAYSTTLVAAGGTLPYAWRCIHSHLPRGLTLNRETGTISGTPHPRQLGLHAFAVQVSHGRKKATATFTVTID
jgi:hypothetical protein